MKLLYARGCDTPSTQKVMIATPAYGSICAEYVVSLYQAGTDLTKAGINNEVVILSGNCHVDDSRNTLVKKFLQSDCTDLVFIDDDTRFRSEDLISLLSFDRDVIGGACRLKQEKEEYPTRYIGDSITAEPDGAIEIEAIGTCFLRIKRHVLEKMAAAANKYMDKGAKKADFKTPLIFERTLVNEARWGGDYTFCKKWAGMGGKIYLAPELVFGHIGNSEWSGSIAEYLVKKHGLTDNYIYSKLVDLTNGENIDMFALSRIWGNEWSAGVEYLTAMSLMAKNADRPILECGSGLTTLVLGSLSKQPVYVLEQDEEHALKAQEWVERMKWEHVYVYHCQIKDYGNFKWFDKPDDLPEFGLVVCDAPRRADGREGLLSVMGDHIKGAKILVDDLITEIDTVNKWGLPFHEFGENESFAVVEA